jgi:hypothetical protein
MDDFDHDYYRLVKEMLDYSIPIQVADKLISRAVLSSSGTLKLYSNGARVGFAWYEATTALEAIDASEIAGIYDWPKMKKCLELIQLEQSTRFV